MSMSVSRETWGWKDDLKLAPLDKTGLKSHVQGNAVALSFWNSLSVNYSIGQLLGWHARTHHAVTGVPAQGSE